ncbi:MAG: hypothetical protein ACOYW7_10025 [Nitrospirota bacterium]
MNNPNAFKLGKKRIVTLILAFIIATNIFFYFNERIHWINDDHAHLKAKEYYVLGRMVFFYRKMLSLLIKVDNPIMSPLNSLQETIYNKGISYIPENDGERAVWKYNFDLYFYGRGFYLPNDGTPETINAVSPLRKKILDDTYNVIETLATKPIADREMNETRYKIFPLIAAFYGSNQYYYFGNEAHYSRGIRLIEDTEKIGRVKKIVYWLVDLRQAWDSNKSPWILNEIRTKEPQIEMFYYDALIHATQNILVRQLADLEFSCEGYYTKLYAQKRREFIDFLSVRQGRIRADQIKLIYGMTFESERAKTFSYLLNAKCGIAPDKGFPDEEWIRKALQEGFGEMGDLMDKSIRRNQ